MKRTEVPIEPSAPHKTLYLTFLFMGVANLLPWNSLIMALDYFIVKLPGHDVDFVVSILSNGPGFLANLVMIVFHKHFPPIKTIVITLALMTIMSLSLPLFPQYISHEDFRWYLVFVTIILMCSVNGVMQSCCYGLAGSLPGNYIASVNTGCALSGLITSVGKALTLILFPTNDDPDNRNYFYGALMFFIIGGACLIFSIILVVNLAKTDYFKYHMYEKEELERNQRHTSHDLQQLVDSGFTLEDVKLIDGEEEDPYSLKNIFKVHNSLIVPGYGIVLVYIQTFLVFPAVMIQGEISIKNISWQVWLIISLFNLTDTVSRYISEKWTLLSSNSAAFATLIRSIIIVFCFLSAYHISFFDNDVFKIVNILLIGFTNGYIGNCQIICGVRDAKDKDKPMAAKIMGLFLVLGIALGSIIASFGIVHMFDSK